MSVTEAERHELYESFKEAHGASVAKIFMNLHTPIDVSPLATKTDLAAFATKADLKAELTAYATKADLAELKADLKAELAAYATKTDLAEFKADMLRTLGTWLIASQSVVVGLIAAFGIFG